MKALYGLQASVMQEVQSRAREDATNLVLDREVKEILQVTCEQIMLEKEEEKKCTDNLEKNLTEVYKSIPDCVQAHEVTTEEKIQQIAQTMERYKQEIVDLTEKLTLSTPPEVWEKREKEATVHVESIVQEVKEVAELYNRTAHIWTSLEEDEKIQQLEQREEKIERGGSGLEEEAEYHGHIPKNEGRAGDEKLAGRSKDCAGGETSKAGSVGAISTTSRRNDRRAPNRERKMGTCARKSREVLREHITMQGLETLAGKSAEAKEKVTELGKKFHALEVALQKVH
jgi:hypothetical protein